MRWGGKSKKCKNGRGCLNGKVRNGAHQKTSKYLSNSKGSLFGAGESIKPAFCDA